MIGKQAERDGAREIGAWFGFFPPAEGIFGILKQLEYEVRALRVAVGKGAAVIANVGSVFNGVIRRNFCIVAGHNADPFSCFIIYHESFILRVNDIVRYVNRDFCFT